MFGKKINLSREEKRILDLFSNNLGRSKEELEVIVHKDKLNVNVNETVDMLCKNGLIKKTKEGHVNVYYRLTRKGNRMIYN